MRKVIVLVFFGLLLYGCSANDNPQPQGKQEMNESPSPNNEISAEKISMAKQKLLKLGMADLNRSKIPEAIKSFSEIIQLDPKDSTGYFILAQTYMHLKRYDNAVSVLDKLVNIDSQNGQAYYMKSIASSLAGKQQEAVDAVQRSILVFQAKQDEKNFKKALMLFQTLSGASQNLDNSIESQASTLDDSISANVPVDSDMVKSTEQP